MASAEHVPKMAGRMSDIDPEHNRRLDRRTFLKGGVVAGGLLAGAGLTIRATADTDTSSSSATTRS